MLFKQSNNEIESSQLKQNRKMRENFHKKIRKEILDGKISQMRKTFFANKVQEIQNISVQYQGQASFLDHFDQRYRKSLSNQTIISSQQYQGMQIISKSLSILGKFNKIFLQTFGSSDMKKFSKKIDAIICLVMNVDQWIKKDLAKADIQSEIGNGDHREKLEGDDEGKQIQERQFIEQIRLMQLDNLKPMIWIQMNSQASRLQLLKEIAHLLLFQKIQLFLNTIHNHFTSQLQTQTQNQASHLISPTLLQWLYFYQQNMKTFYLSSNYQYKYTLQDQNQDLYWLTFTNSYFDIIYKTISLMSLSQLTEIFFNCLQNVNCFRDIGNGYWKKESCCYISCSPYQYLLGNQNEGQRVLRGLYSKMKEKIEAQDKCLFYQQMKRVSIDQIEKVENVHQESLVEILKAKRLLSVLQAMLESTFANTTKRCNNFGE